MFSRKIIVGLFLLGVVAATALSVYRWGSLEQVIAHEESLRHAIRQHAVLAFVAGVAAYVLISLIPGTTGKSIICGWLFGLWQGVLLVNVSLTIAATISFLLSRYYLRDYMTSRFAVHLARINRAIERDGAFYVFSLRVLHFPYTFANYALGATSLSTRDFWVASQLGMFPGNLIFVYAGAQLPTLEQLAEEGVTTLVSPPVMASLVLLGLFPLATKWVLRRLWPRPGAASGTPAS